MSSLPEPRLEAPPAPMRETIMASAAPRAPEPAPRVRPARRLRILKLATCPFPTPQGTQVYIGQMARSLHERGHEVSLVTYGFGAGAIHEHDASVGYRIHRAPGVPGHRSLAAGPSWGRPVADALLVGRALEVVARAARQGAPFDLIHAHNYEGALAGALVRRATGLPLLYHAHNLMGDELETYFEGGRRRAAARGLGRALDRFVPGMADRCVAVSRCAQRRLEALHGGAVHYQPPAVDYGHAARAEVVPGRLVYLGNLDGYQSPGVMLEALGMLAHRPEVRCLVVTADAPARWWKMPGAAQAPVDIVPHGPFAEVKAHLESAQVALLPRTVASGFPIKLLNYLASGRPVVACHSSAQGLGVADGVLAVADGDAAAFAAAVERVLDEPMLRRRLEQGARASAARFGWPAHVEALETIYMELLVARTRPGR